MAELHIIGNLQSGQNFGNSSGHFCKWSIQAGSLWKRVSGNKEGQTQVDTTKITNSNASYWSHPIDVHFVTKAIQGWPKIVLEVYRQDQFGRSDLSGYGVGHIPTCPGQHTIVIPTWRPTGSGREEVVRAFLGGGAELSETDFISNSSERYRLKTASSGTVTLELGIILKDFEKYGINLS